MLDFENYIQVLRNPYYAGEVKENFHKAFEMIGRIPNPNERFIFTTIKTKGKNADWITNNNAVNALEIKWNRKLWKRKSRKQKMPCVKAIEPNTGGFLTYHFHMLTKITDLKVILTDKELKDMMYSLASELKETNENNAEFFNSQVFNFNSSLVNTRNDDFGKALHYCVKSSSKDYDPLANIILPKQKQIQQRQL
jgi:hypothetical protein